MSESSYLGVFRGPDAVAKYFDPELQPPLPLVELPAKLNPFRHDNVRIYAKLLTHLPAQNVKVFPALNMLRHEPGAATKSIVEASSGSTAISLGMAARVLWDNEDTSAYVTNKKHPDQLRLLRFFGLKTCLYGGLAQQEPVDPRGIMCRLRQAAKKDDSICYPGQYDNDHNWKAHARWTGPQIWKQLPEINVFATTIGTGGCITGTGLALKAQKASVRVVGVCNVFGDPTPGPRHFPGFESSSFPWKEAVDAFQTVASAKAYDMSMQLSREGIIAGPSSGEALCGLFSYLQREKDAERLEELADGSTGEVSCVFICCDLPYQYIEGYFQKLGEDRFPPIQNEILLGCDLDRYDERWELTPKQGAGMLARRLRTERACLLCERRSCEGKRSCNRPGTSKVVVLDLRQALDFSAGHVLSSQSSPLKHLTARTGDIFGDPHAVHMHWTNLRAKFDDEAARLGSRASPLLVLCYDGETSRLATSILRARDHKAFSVFGGFSALRGHFK